MGTCETDLPKIRVCIRTQLRSIHMQIVYHMLDDLATEYEQQHVDEEEVKALGINYEYGTSCTVVMAIPHFKRCSLQNFHNKCIYKTNI